MEIVDRGEFEKRIRKDVVTTHELIVDFPMMVFPVVMASELVKWIKEARKEFPNMFSINNEWELNLARENWLRKWFGD